MTISKFKSMKFFDFEGRVRLVFVMNIMGFNERVEIFHFYAEK